ncbi:MAG: hypothetical protein J3K34DRAFT_526456 [Monoraphidium minutum]|nr:MAG: hypothetical protein J3K34DRAFT_526456 [Monoraphidium minutum]
MAGVLAALCAGALANNYPGAQQQAEAFNNMQRAMAAWQAAAMAGASPEAPFREMWAAQARWYEAQQHAMTAMMGAGVSGDYFKALAAVQAAQMAQLQAMMRANAAFAATASGNARRLGETQFGGAMAGANALSSGFGGMGMAGATAVGGGFGGPSMAGATAMGGGFGGPSMAGAAAMGGGFGGPSMAGATAMSSGSGMAGATAMSSGRGMAGASAMSSGLGGRGMAGAQSFTNGGMSGASAMSASQGGGSSEPGVHKTIVVDDVAATRYDAKVSGICWGRELQKKVDLDAYSVVATALSTAPGGGTLLCVRLERHAGGPLQPLLRRALPFSDTGIAMHIVGAPVSQDGWDAARSGSDSGGAAPPSDDVGDDGSYDLKRAVAEFGDGACACGRARVRMVELTGGGGGGAAPPSERSSDGDEDDGDAAGSSSGSGAGLPSDDVGGESDLGSVRDAGPASQWVAGLGFGFEFEGLADCTCGIRSGSDSGGGGGGGSGDGGA